jgi:GNAT superfamily N-acetyltransferase
MGISEQNIPVTMVRPHLEEIPAHTLPASYFLRTYRPGDEQAWVEIQTAADRYNTITSDLFVREFGRDKSVLVERQLYICDADDAAIGTAAAWFSNSYRGQLFGQVHWVAIVPHKQGLGLSKPLMAAVCDRLKELGHSQAYLTTSTARIPAINLYLQFGFKPQIDNTEDAEVWRKLQSHLNAPTVQ